MFEPQEQFGRPYHANDYILINVTVSQPENVAYIVDLYTHSSKAAIDEPPYHLGYHYIMPNVLKKSDGRLELPITCATKHRPLGLMRVDFLKVCAFLILFFFLSGETSPNKIMNNRHSISPCVVDYTIGTTSLFTQAIFYTVLEKYLDRFRCWSPGIWNKFQSKLWKCHS